MVNLHVNCINVMFISFALRKDFSTFLLSSSAFVHFTYLFLGQNQSVHWALRLAELLFVFLFISFTSLFFVNEKDQHMHSDTMKRNQSFRKLFSWIFWMAMSRSHSRHSHYVVVTYALTHVLHPCHISNDIISSPKTSPFDLNLTAMQ